MDEDENELRKNRMKTAEEIKKNHEKTYKNLTEQNPLHRSILRK